MALLTFFDWYPYGLLVGQLEDACHTRCNLNLSGSDLSKIPFWAGTQDGIQFSDEHLNVHFQGFE